jgi:ribosomal protein L11 methyltransferase
LIRLAVRCRPELAERVLAEMVVLAPGGVEEEAGDGWIEFAIYGAPGEVPDLGDVEAAAGDGLVEVETEEIPDDWADRWRDYHEPILVADRVLIRPSWIDPRDAWSRAGPGSEAEEPARIDVVLDPGNAFGTGAHPTTRMCVELLAELAEKAPPGAIADLGTGSGVLAIVAAKLGFGPVTALDTEEAALGAAAANAEANGVELELRRANLCSEPPPPAPSVVANLTAPILREVAGRLADATETVICSGLLDREIAGVIAAFRSAGLEAAGQLADGEWVALRLTRGAAA